MIGNWCGVKTSVSINLRNRILALSLAQLTVSALRGRGAVVAINACCNGLSVCVCARVCLWVWVKSGMSMYRSIDSRRYRIVPNNNKFVDDINTNVTLFSSVKVHEVSFAHLLSYRSDMCTPPLATFALIPILESWFAHAITFSLSPFLNLLSFLSTCFS